MSNEAAEAQDPTIPTDMHQWLSFDLEGETYNFDLTFLASDYDCIFGRGCKGVLSEDATDLAQGCCSYGAHFVDEADLQRVAGFAKRLTPEHWQFIGEAAELGSAFTTDADGEANVTHLVEDACIFLNRPGFSAGAGCALHTAALEAGERPLDWKPLVCWQVPLRLEHVDDDNEHTTITLREWKRRDWGEGGEDFHWWCTETRDAFVGPNATYLALQDEIIELVGPAAYRILRHHIESRPAGHIAPHPAATPVAAPTRRRRDG